MTKKWMCIAATTVVAAFLLGLYLGGDSVLLLLAEGPDPLTNTVTENPKLALLVPPPAPNRPFDLGLSIDKLFDQAFPQRRPGIGSSALDDILSLQMSSSTCQLELTSMRLERDRLVLELERMRQYILENPNDAKRSPFRSVNYSWSAEKVRRPL